MYFINYDPVIEKIIFLNFTKNLFNFSKDYNKLFEIFIYLLMFIVLLTEIAIGYTLHIPAICHTLEASHSLHDSNNAVNLLYNVIQMSNQPL